MGTSNYPHIDHLIGRFESPMLWRIYADDYRDQPLGVGFGYSRFGAPNREFKTLYLAEKFNTALREGLIRDRFDGRKIRRIAEHTVRKKASAIVKTKAILHLVDLTDGNAGNHGIPTVVRHGGNYQQSQAFTLEIHDELPDADGIFYRSRLDDQYCFAVFERAIETCLEAVDVMRLDANPLLRPALKDMRIRTFKWNSG